MGVRNYLDVPRVYIDMDGPAAHFEQAFKAAGADPHTFKTRRGVYRDLAVVEGLLEAIANFEEAGLEVFFLTKIPAANPYAATEKLLWVQEHIPRLLDRVIISSDKAAVGTARDFLVDDHPEWANAQNFRGTVLLFSGDWAPIRKAILGALGVRIDGLLKSPPCVQALNALLAREETGWHVEEAGSMGGQFLRLYAGHGSAREFVAALPRETPGGCIVAMAGVAQYYRRVSAAAHPQHESLT